MFLGVKVPNLEYLLTMTRCISVPIFKSKLQIEIFPPKFQMPITPMFIVVKIPNLHGVLTMTQSTYAPNFRS